MKVNCNVIFQYVIREGNLVTDVLVVFSFDDIITFNYFPEIPSAMRRLLNIDMAQIPNHMINDNVTNKRSHD